MKPGLVRDSGVEVSNGVSLDRCCRWFGSVRPLNRVKIVTPPPLVTTLNGVRVVTPCDWVNKIMRMIVVKGCVVRYDKGAAS